MNATKKRLQKTAKKHGVRASGHVFAIRKLETIYAQRNGQRDTPHRHDYYTVLFVMEGRGNHFIDFERYPMASDQVIFIEPGRVIQRIETELPRGFALTFSTDFLMQNGLSPSFINELNLFRKNGSTPPLPIAIDARYQLHEYCKLMLANHKEGGRLNLYANGALLKLFLVTCRKLCELPVDKRQNLSAAHDIVEGFQGLLDDCVTKHHKVRFYADKLDITPDHLNRCVHKVCGLTTKECIRERLIAQAKRLLFFSPLSVKQVGGELGFQEPSHFGAFFKAATGQTPAGFRAAMQSSSV